MQPNTQSLNAQQLLDQPGVLSFIDSAKDKPMLEVFNALKVAYPNLQGTFVDLKAAVKAYKRKVATDSEPGFVTTVSGTGLLVPIVETPVVRVPPIFEAPVQKWTVLDLGDARAFAAKLQAKLDEASRAFAQAAEGVVEKATEPHSPAHVEMRKRLSDNPRALNGDTPASTPSRDQADRLNTILRKHRPTAVAIVKALLGRSVPVRAKDLAKEIGRAPGNVTFEVYTLRKDPEFRKVAEILTVRDYGYQLRLRA